VTEGSDQTPGPAPAGTAPTDPLFDVKNPTEVIVDLSALRSRITTV
jgi:hypothetical protein